MTLDENLTPARRVAFGSGLAVSASVAAAALAALAGCASPPVRFYTLVAPKTVPAAGPATPAAFDFTLTTLKIPGQVNQSSLVLRLGSGQVAVAENEHWVAPLGDELRAALSGALARRLGTTDVSALARDARRPVVQIAVDVQRFDLLEGRSTALDLVWSARFARATDGAVAGCAVSASQSVAGSGVAALVESQQQAVARVAAQIGATLAAWDGQGVPACAPVDAAGGR